MKAREAVRKVCVSVESSATVGHTAQVMESAAVGTAVVVDDATMVGIVTDRDLVCRVLARHGDRNGRIDAVMTTPVVTIDADDDVRDAFPLFRENAIRRLVVMEGGRPLGVLSIDDLLVDLVADLGDLVRPVTAEVIFGHHDSPVPAVP